jgi:hypothetical protein
MCSMAPRANIMRLHLGMLLPNHLMTTSAISNRLLRLDNLDPYIQEK